MHEILRFVSSLRAKGRLDEEQSTLLEEQLFEDSRLLFAAYSVAGGLAWKGNEMALFGRLHLCTMDVPFTISSSYESCDVTESYPRVS